MARPTPFRIAVSTALVLLVGASLAGCIGGGDPAPSPTASTTRPATPTPTPTRSATPTPAPTTTPSPTPTPTAPPETTGVSVQILNAAYDPASAAISVAGMVTDLVSQTGVCIATASQEGASVSAQSPGMADAAVTYCSNLVLQLPAGASGSWNVELSFADESHAGSASTTVQAG